ELENANLQRLTRLIDLGQQLAAERDPDRLLETFCHEARNIVGALYAAVGILNGEHNSLRSFFTSGFECKSAADDDLAQISQYFLSAQFQTRPSLRFKFPTGKAKPFKLLPCHPPVASFLGAPLTQQGQVHGWLYLAGKRKAEEFNKADERLAVTLTSQAMVAWENARLYAETQRHAANLEQEITERKQLEKERAELLVREQMARREAEEANRLKDEFLATVSHELRAPLNAMLGWATLVRNGKLRDEAKERAIETIERNAHIQKKLI